jgi:uncharacterized protein YqfA (UPF0365 family)
MLISGVRITFSELFLMRLRKSPIQDIVRGMIEAVKGGVSVNRIDLEVHAMAGGNINNVVHALILAKKSGLKLNYSKACRADLNDIDLVEEVKKEVASRNKDGKITEELNL